VQWNSYDKFEKKTIMHHFKIMFEHIILLCQT